jgi:hypothetical protein
MGQVKVFTGVLADIMKKTIGKEERRPHDPAE